MRIDAHHHVRDPDRPVCLPAAELDPPQRDAVVGATTARWYGMAS